MKTWHKLLAAALLAAGLTACGGGDSSGSGDNGNLAQAAVSRSGELTAFVQQRLRALSAQGQLGGMAGAAGGDAVPAGPTASVAGAPARSSTLVQEAGVDEADLMLSDGSTIYTVQPAAGAGPTLASWQRGSDGRVTRLGSWSLPLDGAAVADTDGMHLSDDHRTLAVISRSWVPGPYPPGCADLCPTLAPVWMASTVNVQRVDVGNPAQAVPGERIQIDGSLVDSRHIGNQLYVVTRWQPVLSAQVMPASATAAEREAAIAALKPSDLLPRMRRNGGPSEPLLNETDCYVRGDIASNTVQLTAVTVFDLRDWLKKHPICRTTSRCFS